MQYVHKIFAKSYLKLVVVLSIILISKVATGSVLDDKASDFETPIANFETLQSSTTEKYGEWLIALSPQPKDVDSRRSRAFDSKIRSELIGVRPFRPASGANMIGPIAIADDRTFLVTELARTYLLTANPSEVKGHEIDYERSLTSTSIGFGPRLKAHPTCVAIRNQCRPIPERCTRSGFINASK